MKKKTALWLISRGCQKQSILAAYLADQKEIVERRSVEQPKKFRNPTITEFQKWGVPKCTIYAAAKLVEIDIKNGEILLTPKRGLVYEK